MRRVVVLTIEGLGTNLVGCYGAAVAPTKNWDRFATRCAVFDQFWSDSLVPLSMLESIWTGTHAVERSQGLLTCFPSKASGVCGQTLLVTDSMALTESAMVEHLGEVLFVGDAELETQAASEVDVETSDFETAFEEESETQFSRLIEAGLGKWINELHEYSVLWIHSTGLNSEWDAPYRYRCVICDEGDPAPPKETAPAILRVEEDTDPDEIFGLVCAAGGQAIAMDDAWELIETALENTGIEQDCLVVLMGACGYPLGEHGWVGGPGQMYAESIHLPLMVRPGRELPLGVRVPSIVQPDALLALIDSWLAPHGTEQAPVDSKPQSWLSSNQKVVASELPTQVAYTMGDTQQHLLVPAWSCRWSSDSIKGESAEVYVMPDDRWQQNEIARRAHDVELQLGECRDQWIRWKTGQQPSFPELSSDLTDQFR